jgi:hypothetical protein
MIDKLLQHVRSKVDTYIKNKVSSTASVILTDVAKQMSSSEGEGEEGKGIYLTLVNIEEETSLKNNYPVQRIGSNIVELDPSVHMNLYLLFSANPTNYEEGLKQISRVIEFFQFNRVMNVTLNDQSYEVRFNLYNIGFENLNNLWTVLGGRYLPSVIYKARLLMFQETPPTVGPAIVEVEGTESL